MEAKKKQEPKFITQRAVILISAHCELFGASQNGK